MTGMSSIDGILWLLDRSSFMHMKWLPVKNLSHWTCIFKNIFLVRGVRLDFQSSLAYPCTIIRSPITVHHDFLLIYNIIFYHFKIVIVISIRNPWPVSWVQSVSKDNLLPAPVILPLFAGIQLVPARLNPASPFHLNSDLSYKQSCKYICEFVHKKVKFLTKTKIFFYSTKDNKVNYILCNK